MTFYDDHAYCDDCGNHEQSCWCKPISVYDNLCTGNCQHRPISVGGWNCDLCGRAVNGQTDDQGWPLIDGDSVRHTE